MGLLDFDMSKITGNDSFMLGMNILGNSYNRGGQFGPAMSGGLQDYQRQKSLQAQQNRANTQAEMQRKQQEMQNQLRQQQEARAQTQFQQQQAQNKANMAVTGGMSPGLYQHQNPNHKRPPTPSNINEWNAYSKMPQKDKEAYLQMKRASKTFDTGAQQGMYNQVTNQPMPLLTNQLKPSERPEIKEQQAAATKRGTMGAQAKAQAEIDLPQTKFNADYTKGLLNKARSHPGRESGTGFSSLVPSRPGGDAYDFDIVMKQIKGKQFLTAFEQLKGAGQITEIEGQKATEAEARMDQAQSEDEFLTALDEYEKIINALALRAQKKAGGSVDGNVNWSDL